MLRRLAAGVIAVVCCAAVTATAFGMSSGDLVGSVNGSERAR